MVCVEESIFNERRSGKGSVDPRLQNKVEERNGGNINGTNEAGNSPEKGSAERESMAPVFREEDKKSQGANSNCPRNEEPIDCFIKSMVAVILEENKSGNHVGPWT
ncbi:hypothetical protein L6452_06479 [Arctium lappa]|uniref:Uncharacterized protein n=1 Tax=Arctium lappa TaxID=4217 RepID=A0ACB9EKC7_ARCLA|nr:hypothetical protein L6452_06479 [Arctium lappa]